MTGLAISPLILNFSKHYENYKPVDKYDPSSETLGDFMKWYFEKGLNCIFHVNPDISDISDSNKCHYSFYYMTGYVLSLFMLQITLTYLMQMKKARNLRTIFALMVPITFGAFMLGGLTNPIIKIDDNDPLNIVSTHTSINLSRNILSYTCVSDCSYCFDYWRFYV